MSYLPSAVENSKTKLISKEPFINTTVYTLNAVLVKPPYQE